MHGKICMVTGASSGIGKAIAVKLATMGATVVAVCRDPDRGESAQREIKAVSHSDAVELVIADLASQAAIRKLVADYKYTHDCLDVLINNAGVNLSTYSKTVDGIERTFAINYLAPFLLTNLLLDVLKASGHARVINYYPAHWQGRFNIDNLMQHDHYNGLQAYQQAQIARQLFSDELARRVDGSGITVNCVGPGFVRTNLGRDTKGWFKLFLAVMSPFMASATKGAETPVYVATAPELEGVSGKHFTNRKEDTSATSDPVIARRLWEISSKLAGLNK